eukprot:scaffold22052_cov36-Cyclotella_meneghiniana.AAC.6
MSILNYAIRQLNENKLHRIRFYCLLCSSLKVVLIIPGCAHIIEDLDEFNRLGEAIGSCTSLRRLSLGSHYRITEDYHISNESYECLEAIYKGLERNRSIAHLSMSVDFLPDKMGLFKALCDTSSLEGIIKSNHHTLQVSYLHGSVPQNPNLHLLEDFFKLNLIENKDEVIREKIARYYFIGDFDISPFTKISVSVLPKVLSLIKGSNINRQSAIFRMLKTFPELCNVSSRDARNAGDREGSGTWSNKRPKIDNQ